LSESSRQVFSYRLLIATTNFIGNTAGRTLNDQEKPVGKVFFFDLEKSDLEWPESPESLHAKIHEPKKPLPHQQKAISEVCKGFSDSARGQIIMACGTGKTLVSLWVAEKLQSHRTLVLVPSLSLLAQTLREWTANASQKFHFLPVCSDDTVRGEDHLIAKTSDLGLPVTTDAKEVAAFMGQPGLIVIFSTYQSSPVIAEAFAISDVPFFDLAIADEAHRCAGLASGPFATILDSTAIKTKCRLFMTATPRYFTDRIQKEADQLDFEIASMDDISKFGKIFHLLSFSDAIKQNLLSDYRVVIIGVDDDTYRRYAEYGRFVTTDGKKITDARTLASQIAIVKAMHKYNLRRVISFHSRIKKAKVFSDELPEVVNWMPENLRPNGNFWSAHVSGEMPSGHRDALLDRFRHLADDERGLLANARCLGEGVDIPTLDGVAFIDPRHSQIDIVQAVGRAIRKAPDKKIGTIVLPVFIEPTDDPEKALDSSAFRPVWDVLKALRAHDTVLGETLDLLRTQLGQFGKITTSFPEKLIIDLPITVGKSFTESLYIKVVERSTTSWEFFFGLLELYIQHKGTTIVPINYITKKGDKLGIWVAAQRHNYKKGKLSKEYQAMLERLHGWVWDRSEAVWREGFKRLCEYYHRYGHTDVPASYVTEDNYNLGTWVASQKAAYKKGKLSLERERAFKSLQGWVWKSKSNLTTVPHQWQRWFNRLRLFVKRNDHSSVPFKYKTEDGYSLGAWVRTQKQSYKKGKLSFEQKQALEQLPGWVWRSHRKSYEWTECYNYLHEYVKREGHSNVPGNYKTEEGFNLGSWVRNQRSTYILGKLSLKQQMLLEKIPHWVWHVHTATWIERYKRLCDYVKREGTASVRRKHVEKDGFKLGLWVMWNRERYRQHRLSKERQRMLEQITGWSWSPRKGPRKNAGWAKKLERLYKYSTDKGHACVPANYVTKDGCKLGIWVRDQRYEHKKGTLTREQEQALEQLPGWVWSWSPRKDPHKNAGWAKNLERLCKYSVDKGHAYVPTNYVTKDGHKLGTWVRDQRYQHGKGKRKLSKEQEQALEQLPGWLWNATKKCGLRMESNKWMDVFERLRKYVDLKGSSCVPYNYIAEDGLRLGLWVTHQRQVYKKGKLSLERQQALEQLPGWVWACKSKRTFDH
jgi:superfamily II DNA or RNA helicase